MKSMLELYVESQNRRRTYRLAYIWITVLILFLFLGPLAFAQEAEIRKVATQEALENGLDPELVMAVIEVESRFNPQAVGQSHGEIGLMQLRPKYFPTATHDIHENIRIGVEELVRIKKSKWKYAGCAWFVYYNTGVNRALNSPSEHPYFKKVTEVYPNYCQRFDVAGVE